MSIASKIFMNNFRITKKFIKDNENIMFVRADKGRISVAIDYADYCKQGELLFGDLSTYEKLKKYSVNKINEKFKELLDRWKLNNFISEKEYYLIRNDNSIISKAYLLPKVHKEKLSFRPIVSTVGSATYFLAQFLTKILSKITGKTNTFVKDVWSFREEIKNFKIADNHRLISLDVTSLYTNVSVEHLIKILNEKADEIKLHTSIPINEILIAVRVVLNETVFSFNNTIYKQKFGCSMGNPLSRVAADIVMEKIEQIGLRMLQFSPCFFKRYIDDVLTTVPINMLEQTLNSFNSIDNKIKFTHEIEKDCNISFLDLKLQRNNDGSISCNWFRKKTWSGRYINYFSEHSDSVKTSLIKGLVDRAVLLSDKEFIDENLKIIENTLLNNNYPKDFIKKQIKNRFFHIKNKNSNSNNNDNNINDNNHKAFCSIPYVNGLSERIRREFNKFGIRIIFRNNGNNLKRFFNYHKDKEKKGKFLRIGLQN